MMVNKKITTRELIDLISVVKSDDDEVLRDMAIAELKDRLKEDDQITNTRIDEKSSDSIKGL